MNCSFCASAGAAIAVLPSAASAIPMCLPIIDFPPLMGRTARAGPRAATRQRRRAWLRIFVVGCSLPCDPPVGGHSCNGEMIPRFQRSGAEAESLRMTPRERTYLPILRTTPAPTLCELRHRGLARPRVALLRLAALCQPRIPKDGKERSASTIRERICSALAIVDDESLDGHGLHCVRGDANGGMADAGRGAEQDHALLCGERRRHLCHDLFTPPTLRERCHRGLARCRVAGCRR